MNFRNDALRGMADITAQGKIPLLVGGTMLYYKALIEGLSPLPSADEIFVPILNKSSSTRLGSIAYRTRQNRPYFCRPINPVILNGSIAL